MAQRMTMLYGFNSPEFFDRALFGSFINLLRSRGVLRVDAAGHLAFDDVLMRGGARCPDRALGADPPLHPAGHARLAAARRAHFGHSHPNTPAVIEAYTRPSIIVTIVMRQLRRYQIEACGSASE